MGRIWQDIISKGTEYVEENTSKAYDLVNGKLAPLGINVEGAGIHNPISGVSVDPSAVIGFLGNNLDMLGVDGDAMAGVSQGMGIGASLGSVVPGIGTVLGTGIGAVIGGLSAIVGRKPKRNYYVIIDGKEEEVPVGFWLFLFGAVTEISQIKLVHSSANNFRGYIYLTPDQYELVIALGMDSLSPVSDPKVHFSEMVDAWGENLFRHLPFGSWGASEARKWIHTTWEAHSPEISAINEGLEQIKAKDNLEQPETSLISSLAPDAQANAKRNMVGTISLIVVVVVVMWLILKKR